MPSLCCHGSGSYYYPRFVEQFPLVLVLGLKTWRNGTKQDSNFKLIICVDLHVAEMMSLFCPAQTWVGNKRRKLASKVELNGGMSHSLSSHGLASGLLSNHTLAGGALSSHGLVGGGLLPVEIAAARNIQNRLHLLPPSTTFPSFSSASSSPLSSSPISSGSSSNNNNNNDVILTGIYSLGSVPRSRQRTTGPSSQSDSELPPSSLISQALQSRSSSTSSPLHSKLVSLSQCIPSLTSASGPLVYTAVRKGASSLGEAGVSTGAGVVPPSWTRQYGTTHTHPGPSSSQPQTQLQSRPHSSPQPPAPPSQKTSASPVRDSYPWIQQAFSLSEANVEDRLGASQGASEKGLQSHRPPLHPRDTVHNFSIAMETGDEEDEWRREEELANMAAQTHIRAPASPDAESLTPPAASSRPTMLHSSVTLQGSFSAQTSFTGESSTQVRHVHPFFSFLNNDLI